MSDNGNKPDHEGLAAAIARALRPQFEGVAATLSEIRTELSGVSSRLDKVVENTGGHYRRLEDRITRLETKVFSDDDDDDE